MTVIRAKKGMSTLPAMRSVILFLLLFFVCSAYAQQQNVVSDRPKLVVGIVVDQMKQEYLYRYQSKFGNDGFRRLMGDGFMLKNAHYNFAPTYTGPGHASVYTGATPSVHGVIGNDFYDKQLKKMVNCVSDPMHTAIGSPQGKGNVSPWRMQTTTITDELKLFTNEKSKVIGISIKDRGAVLPAGHMADAAYWLDKEEGKFITSTYYMNALPPWVEQFNGKNLADIYLSQEWKTLLPIEQYTESGPDLSPYERKFQGKDKSVFPYNLKAMRAANGNFDLITYTPYGNDLVTEFTKTAIVSEKLGKNATTDFLCLSYSSPDILGHSMGPRSVEVEDMYLRLDRNIADILKKLDQEVGAGNYLVFLTADHGVADVPQFLKDNKVPAGYFKESNALALLNEFLESYFPGKNLIENISNEQVFLNHEAFQGAPKASGMDFFIVSELIGKYLMTLDGVANYYTEGVLRQGRFDEEGMKGMIIRGYHAKRSGDIVIVLEPNWMSSGWVQGTTHGSPYNYDTHVPVIFYGKGIRKGSTVRYHSVTDIAPTLSMMLNITLPNGSSGKPIEELFE